MDKLKIVGDALRYASDKFDLKDDSYTRLLSDIVDLNQQYRPLPYNDKYKHAMINCLMSQKGEKGEKVASLLSGLKENYDVYYDINKPEDSDGDMEANIYGRKVGRENKNKSCDEMVRLRYNP